MPDFRVATGSLTATFVALGVGVLVRLSLVGVQSSEGKVTFEAR